MIECVTDSDIGEIRDLIAAAVRQSVVSSEDEAKVLIEDIYGGLDWWLSNKADACHLKYVLEGKIVGMILIANFWNLCSMFVHPSFYKHGIGRSLFEAALPICREKGEAKKITLNSSTFASGFYKAIGFVQTGSSRDLPGGCIPHEYILE